jgi:hypothetical protein
VEQAEANTSMEVEETMGDCAYGDGRTRQAFADAGRQLVAKVPQHRGQAYFPKEDFTIDLATMTAPVRRATSVGPSPPSVRGNATAPRGFRGKPSGSTGPFARGVPCGRPACGHDRGAGVR